MAKRAFGAYAIRIAPTKDKKKWKMEIRKTAREAVKYARTASKNIKTPVCVFDLSRWERKPVCFSESKRVPFNFAPTGMKPPRPGGKLRRLAIDRSGMPIVKED